ncbi:hypothetical protein PsYK624_133370 [Phanerochaete sordida]|uniref:Uncharacterized protein n=1 Tax=Phanerochaete sordida TaxID=48140 RepID=A0A9P3GLU2_9APHY|nr:hypothetical protein PsYK624_133370 [Phanerochaete sordida]
MPGYSVPYVHSGDPGYAPPVLRAPSPTDSIGTDYGPDETTPDEESLTDAEFDLMCRQHLRLGDVRPDEMRANIDPILPKPKNVDEERLLYYQVMNGLRAQVRRLQEDHLFEQTVLRGSVVADERQPMSHDIDVILQSMMGTSTDSPARTPANIGQTPLPTHNDFLSSKAMPHFPDFPSPGLADTSLMFPEPTSGMIPQSSSTPAVGRRVTRNMTRTGHR